MSPSLAGRDVLASTQTGSSKTAAFLLPILNHLIAWPRHTTLSVRPSTVACGLGPQDFDYEARPKAKLEIPLAEGIARGDRLVKSR